MINAWKKLPFAKQAQLAKAYGIKWYGTTLPQLEFELSTKLPKGLLVKEPVEEPKVVEVEEVVIEAPLEEVKVEEPKKKKKKK